MVPCAVMISTGSRGCRACTASIRAMPSVGSMRRSSRATSKRPPSTAVTAAWGSAVAVTSKPIVARRISSTSTMAVSSSTTSTLRFITGPSSPSLQFQVHLLELFQICLQPVGFRAHAHELAVATVQVLAQPGQLLAQPAELGPRAEQRPQRVAAGGGTRGALGLRVLRQVVVVGDDGLVPGAVAGEAVSTVEQRGAGVAGVRYPGAPP